MTYAIFHVLSSRVLFWKRGGGIHHHFSGPVIIGQLLLIKVRLPFNVFIDLYVYNVSIVVLGLLTWMCIGSYKSSFVSVIFDISYITYVTVLFLYHKFFVSITVDGYSLSHHQPVFATGHQKCFYEHTHTYTMHTHTCIHI